MNRTNQAPRWAEFGALMQTLHAALSGDDHERQRMAIDAAGALHDVSAVHTLIELVKSDSADLATEAQQALLEITKQDFGASRWRWRAWWDKHSKLPRLQWLFDGLDHGEASVRQSAEAELKLWVPDSFGYRFDGPKRERDEARRKWRQTWEATQKR
jgi:hypothetical protein